MTQTWKTVRVFISSTFRDMHAERDHLVRFVFPRLREELLSRRIHFVDVDLRWGVTSKQDASEVCREIIDHCRPRFMCMLGGHYGSVPSGKNHSITADEVHYGVLDRMSNDRVFAYFYFRDEAATAAMVEITAAEFREPQGRNNQNKLAKLKQSIIDAGLNPFTYSAQWDNENRRLTGFKQFGDRVYDDLLASMKSDPNLRDHFVMDTAAQLDELAEENAAMETFVEERSERFVLGSREAVLNELLAHASATGGNGYVYLTGAPGRGKSALLAHLSQHSTLNSQPSTIVIRHFVGASPASTDVRRTLRRLCHELKAGCPEITAEIPDDPEKLRVTFPDLLRQACAHKRVVILLDAVNQFDPTSHFSGLYWLPETLPANARVILSALDGPALEELRRRPHQSREIELKALTAADGEAIIEQFRQRYHKEFERDQRATLLAKTDAGTPLYLLTALEELRTLGTYEEITRRIAELPPTIHELFAWILERLENDDGFRDASGQRVGNELVPHLAALLSASRYGMSQRELADMLAHGNVKADPPIEPDPQGNVAALLHLLRPYLMHRGELLDFYHGQFRETVLRHYIVGSLQPFHAEIARYLNSRWSVPDTHALSELPYHLYEGSLRDRLLELLSHRSFIDLTSTLISRETMLDHLQLGFAEARIREDRPVVARLLAAWGYAMQYGTADPAERIEQLIRDGRWQEAHSSALVIRPLPLARAWLVRLAHHALDANLESFAKSVLNSIIQSQLAIAKENLTEELQLVDRFTAAQNWYVLDTLHTSDPRTMAGKVLCFLIGTRNFSENLVQSLLPLLKRLSDPYWRGICLLVLCGRALRYGFASVRQVIHRLIETIDLIPPGDHRTRLLESMGRFYHWLAGTGVSPKDLGLVCLSSGHAHSTHAPLSPVDIDRIEGECYGSFQFLQVNNTPHTNIEVDPNALVTVIQTAIGSVFNATDDRGILYSLNLATEIETLLSPLKDSGRSETPDALFLMSLLPPDHCGGIPHHRVPHILALVAEFSQEPRMRLLGSLIRLGYGDSVWDYLKAWEAQFLREIELDAPRTGEAWGAWLGTLGGPSGQRLAGLYQALGELNHWPRAAEFLISASTQLRTSLKPIPPCVLVALAGSLLHHCRPTEASFWIDHLISDVAPHMTLLGLRSPSGPWTAEAYAFLAQAVPVVIKSAATTDPVSRFPDCLAQTLLQQDLSRVKGDAILLAKKLASACAPLAASMSSEFSERTVPLFYLADRLTAWSAEEVAWQDRKPGRSLSFFRRILQLGVLDDDRERKRTWFFWLLFLSADPSSQDIGFWREGTESALALLLPHEELLYDLCGGHVPTPDADRRLFLNIATLLGELPNEMARASIGRLVDGVLRRFEDPAHQAEVMAFLAEMAARRGDSDLAAVFVASSDALMPSMEPFAQQRTRLGKLAAVGRVEDLEQWHDVSLFVEAFGAVLNARNREHTWLEVLPLTRYLRLAPDAWRELLTIIVNAPLSAEEGVSLARVLMNVLKQYCDNHKQNGNCYGKNR